MTISLKVVLRSLGKAKCTRPDEDCPYNENGYCMDELGPCPEDDLEINDEIDL